MAIEEKPEIYYDCWYLAGKNNAGLILDAMVRIVNQFPTGRFSGLYPGILWRLKLIWKDAYNPKRVLGWGCGTGRLSLLAGYGNRVRSSRG